MKIAITTAGTDFDAAVDTRFGRAPQFLIHDTESNTSYIKNNDQNLNAAQGAGIQSAMHLCSENIDCVITGNCGPKAFATLDAAEIKVYTCPEITISEAIQKLKNGELKAAQEANVEGHWA